VGNTVLVQNTMYQNSLSLSATYTLFDFGVRDRRVFIAARDVEAKKAMLLRSVRDTRISILKLYGELLITHRQLECNLELLTLHKQLTLTKERLYQGGTISRIEVVDEALKTVRIVDTLESLQLRMRTLLHDLSIHTGEEYHTEGLKVADLKDPGEAREPFQVERLPEHRVYENEIEKKKAELDALKRERLPQFAFYSTYAWYGSDLNAYAGSIHDVKPRNFFVGVSATLPLFDGFKNSAQIERAGLEMDRLKVEREKKLTELTYRYATLAESQRTYAESARNQTEMLAKIATKLSMSERLSERQIIEYADLLAQRIELVSQRFELMKTTITKSATARELQILSGYN
jgi:outer membrane protein